MKIRPYEANDLAAVIKVFRSNIPKYFSANEEPDLHNFLASSPADYFALEINNELIGAGGIAMNGDQTVSLCWGMIRSDYIGRGLGRVLAEFRIERACERFGTLPIVLSTSQHTRGFYEKFGFHVIEHVAEGFGPGIDICRMRLEYE